MFSVPENVRQDLVTLVPASLLNQISCFTFYDDHPRDTKNVDIITCTIQGELQEFYKRDLVNSTLVDSSWKPEGIKILRNRKCQLFYLVSCRDEIAIISRTEKLQITQKIKNVESYELEDFHCTGQARLKIVFKDDAVPFFYDEDFKKLGDLNEILANENADDSLPLVTQLARKLTEANYTLKCNRKVLKDLTSLRQHAAYSSASRSNSKATGAVFQGDSEATSPLRLKNSTPWIRICSKKVTLILEASNTGSVPLEDVRILLDSAQASMVYTTKLFENIPAPPFWKEKSSNTITSSSNTAIVLVIDLKELQSNVTSKVTLHGVITFNIKSLDYLVQFESTDLSSLELMRENFDVLSEIHKESNKFNVLCVLAASEKVELCLRHIKTENETDINLLGKLCVYLNMEHVFSMDNVVVHRCAPYHPLNGVLVVEEQKCIGEDKWIISLYARSHDQIIAFIHFMHDALPHRIITTTTGQIIISKVPELSKYNEDQSLSSRDFDYSKYKSSLLKQTILTLDYLDECMMKMNENKNPTVQSKIGSEIDIFAGGASKFEEFRKKILEETDNAIKCVNEESLSGVEGMVIDIN